MTGPEHYKKAEQALAAANKPYFGDNPGCPEEMALLATAQVHATLALTAATYDASPGPYVAAWAKVLDPRDGVR